MSSTVARLEYVDDRADEPGADRDADETDDEPDDEAEYEYEAGEFVESDPVLDLAPEPGKGPVVEPPPPAPTGYQASTLLPTRNLPHVLVFEDGRWQRGSIVFAPDDTLRGSCDRPPRAGAVPAGVHADADRPPTSTRIDHPHRRRRRSC